MSSPSPPATSLARVTSFIVLLLGIGLIGGLFVRVMSSFLLPLFLAALLVVVFGPAHNWWVRRLSGRRKTTALITTFLIVLTILLPLAWALVLGITEGVDLAAGDWSQLPRKLSGFREATGLEMPFGNLLDRIRRQIDGLTGPTEADDEWLQRFRRRLDSTERLLARLHTSLQMVIKDQLADPDVSIETAIQADTQLEALRTVTARARLLVADDVTASTLDDDQWQELRDLTTRLQDIHRRMRQETLGGMLSAWLIELANPNPAQLRVWRDRVGSYLRGWLLSLTGQTTALLVRLLVGLAIMVLSIYYFFVDGPQMVRSIMRLSPLADRYEEELLAKFNSVSRSVVVATLLSAVVQGLLAGIGYFLAGAGSLFLLIILTTILALVPFVGAVAVWLPTALWIAFVENRTVAAVGLGIYGMLVISMADNVIKPYVLHGQSNMHPLLALLSVLGGVQVLGPIGILVGPMLVAFLHALLDILRQELLGDDKGNGSHR